MADLDAVVAKYVELRDAKKAIEARQKVELVPYVQALEKIEAFLKGKLDESKVESMNTTSGTFFKVERTSVTTANKETFLDWCKKNDEWDMLDVRPMKTNVIAYKDKHKDIPPGLNYRAEIEVQVRRS